MILQFNEHNFEELCNQLGSKDPVLQAILDEHGYPPYWTRPNTYETLVLTILEQQVSLASAYAAYKKLKERIDPITPEALLQLSDEELRASYLTRQKIGYTRILANAVLDRVVDLDKYEGEKDEVVREELKRLKGIGDWTVDIYLLHALKRTDIYPLGDIALVNGIKWSRGLEAVTKEELLQIGEQWRPYRSIATMIIWHYYIKKRNIKVVH